MTRMNPTKPLATSFTLTTLEGQCRWHLTHLQAEIHKISTILQKADFYQQSDSKLLGSAKSQFQKLQNQGKKISGIPSFQFLSN